MVATASEMNGPQNLEYQILYVIWLREDFSNSPQNVEEEDDDVINIKLLEMERHRV